MATSKSRKPRAKAVTKATASKGKKVLVGNTAAKEAARPDAATFKTAVEALKAGVTFGQVTKRFGITDREAHYVAFRAGLIDPKTSMGQGATVHADSRMGQSERSESAPELVESRLVEWMGPQFRKLPVAHVVDVDDPSVECAPPRPPRQEPHKQHRVVPTQERVVDLMLDAPLRQFIFEVVEGFKCAAAPMVSSDMALAWDVSHKVVRVEGPVSICIAGLDCSRKAAHDFRCVHFSAPPSLGNWRKSPGLLDVKAEAASK
jgi:hypothetical protein